MALSFLYLAVRALLGALVHSRRGLHVKDFELLVLRHELVRPAARRCPCDRWRRRSPRRPRRPCKTARPVAL
jgi:hypothetical protein